VFQGAAERYGTITGEVQSRLETELGVIGSMGFDGYFLIVWDLIHHARERGIRVGPGRGSAAGSVVSYCLRITDLDPLKYGLIFERFLNPDRKQMPDIDMDFDERRRGDMIRYATEKYGEERVSQIITLRHHQGEAGRQGRVAGAGLPLRHRRQDHQGDARPRDGQGHLAVGHLRPQQQEVRRSR